MKAYHYISIIIVLTLGSCNSALYTGNEYDDLYYVPSDRPVSEVRPSANHRNPMKEGNLKSKEYYDNIYAADTLVSDEYSDAIDTDNYNNNGSFDYLDDYSYSGRLRRFYGNYFDPYWRDPFYSGFYSPFRFSFGYGGFPYYNSYNFYNPYFSDPFYGDYYGYYGGLYGNYWGGGFYNSFYSPFYSPYGYYSGINIRDGRNSADYGRRERQSNLSSKWNSMAGSGSSRRDPYLSSGSSSTVTRRSSSTSQQAISPESRRAVSTSSNQQNPVTSTDRKSMQDYNTKSGNQNQGGATRRSSTGSRPEYNNVERSYTPTYSNPRMSTRPSYNNSRVRVEPNSGVNQNSRYINSNRSSSNINEGQNTRSQSNYRSPSNNLRTSPSTSTGQGRYVPSYGNRSSNYSVPTRRSAESGSGVSSGSYYNSRSSSSYGGGSSYSGSGGSYSGGSSSSSSSSRGSSGSSSGSRR